MLLDFDKLIDEEMRSSLQAAILSQIEKGSAIQQVKEMVPTFLPRVIRLPANSEVGKFPDGAESAVKLAIELATHSWIDQHIDIVGHRLFDSYLDLLLTPPRRLPPQPEGRIWEQAVSCSQCRSDSFIAAATGIHAESLNQLMIEAETEIQEFGCDIFACRTNANGEWSIYLLESCLYKLTEDTGSDIIVDHYNHPMHHIGSPYEVLRTGITYFQALEFAKTSKRRPIQVHPSNRDWSVLAGLTEEQETNCKRLARSVDALNVKNNLYDVDIYKDYVLAAAKILEDN